MAHPAIETYSESVISFFKLFELYFIHKKLHKVQARNKVDKVRMLHVCFRQLATENCPINITMSGRTKLAFDSSFWCHNTDWMAPVCILSLTDWLTDRVVCQGSWTAPVQCADDKHASRYDAISPTDDIIIHASMWWLLMSMIMLLLLLLVVTILFFAPAEEWRLCDRVCPFVCLFV